MIYSDKGYIGCFEMKDKEVGKRQLAEYVNDLKSAGHKRIIAPINGDTWHTYRLVSWSEDEPFFPMEPQNPLWYNEVLVEAGFKPLKKYSSGKFPLGNIESTKNDKIKIRNFNKAESRHDLERIYELSLQGFDENFLYNDISKDEFLKLYQPLLPMLDEELMIFAVKDGKTAGFIFTFLSGENLILKTMAVLPEFRSSGIGAALMNHVLMTGQEKGLRTAVAALMSEENYSQRIVGKYGSKKFREYTLYSLEV
ncbi:MAG: GNAT family N-acetyltransferase [Oscillospiraceae bacterium]|jgi:GNAT superfamily N-acetyltransferase|nr:GNAT family N-acetyltransferase [Oscillospiraceae bacterium]